MKTYSNSLISELNRQLEQIHAQRNEPIKYAEQAIKISIKRLEELKTFFINYKFKDAKEEVDFFKCIKPQFVYKLIYYNEIYNIESSKPYGSEKALRRFFNNELDKL